MKTRPTALIVVLMVGWLSGCGGDPGTPAATPAPERPPGLRIAMIAKSAKNPVFLSARNGADAAAQELAQKHGIPIEIVWMTPDDEDAQVQAERIAQAVKEQASAILISCSDAGKVSGAIDDAVNRGVPVMTFDSDAAGSKRFAFYGVDDEKLGETVMRELATLLRKKGAVAVLAGSPDAPNLRRRADGVKKEAAVTPGIKIVGTFTHVETAKDGAEEVLRAQKAHPEIQGWAMVGGWPLFTPRLMDLDPAKVKIVAVDALPAQLAYVEKGLAPVLLAQPTYMWGYVSVQRIIDKVHLKQDVPEIIPMDVVRVTKSNLGSWARQLRTWGFTVPETYVKLP
ncbi:MAG TPA: substrate-binding domain-containing protein [Vicinamibacterales bacterium]|nr:substrate-binding domain-containing protein [Vicinamibacterales bacterium]